jgi:hypothetical protein
MQSAALRVAAMSSALAMLAACDSQPGNISANSAAGASEAAAPGPALLALPTGCDTPTTPFCSSTVPLPPNWRGRIFQLAQDYPQAPPAGDPRPWLQYDPRTQPMQYVGAVLAYFYQGNVRANVENSFDPTLNQARAWYNAPWQDQGFNGREPIHGLTRERVSAPGELHRCQTSRWNNYAVGFYNAAGASTIARVWANRGQPDPAQGIMPEGTVAAKLLFTTASVAEVPYLAGAPTWNAYIYSQVNSPNPSPARAVVPVRLLQIDLAVKDDRVPTGWVFGTYVYGGGPQGAANAPCPPASGTPDPVGRNWNNVAPVGLMWGNDPGYSGTGPLTETWLNPAVSMPHVGLQGRLNGPVDNPASSCMSCHSTAQWPSSAPMLPPRGADPAPWFRDIPSGTPFTPGAQSLDYSLQIQVGIRNFITARTAANPAAPQAQRSALIGQLNDRATPRDGAPTH